MAAHEAGAAAGAGGSARDTVLADTDLLFLIASHACEAPAVHAMVAVSHAWRAAALRDDLTFWLCCDRHVFAALEPPSVSAAISARFEGLNVVGGLAARAGRWWEGAAERWNTGSVTRLLGAKQRVTSLDISGLRIPSAAAAANLVASLPSSLSSLALCSAISQPDAMLAALLSSARLPQLPNLTSLDMRAVCTERTLAALRLLRISTSRQPSGGGGGGGGGGMGMASVPLTPHLAQLRTLCVGFHTFTALGVREGEAFLSAQEAAAPSLQVIGCNVAATGALTQGGHAISIAGVLTLSPWRVCCVRCRWPLTPSRQRSTCTVACAAARSTAHYGRTCCTRRSSRTSRVSTPTLQPGSRTRDRRLPCRECCRSRPVIEPSDLVTLMRSHDRALTVSR
jgi:hypothetical protein